MIWGFQKERFIEKLKNMALIKSVVRKMFVVSGVAVFLLIGGCSISYTFSGASIPEAAKTFSVSYFSNQADFVNPTLSQQFTENLKDYFSRQTRLDQVAKNGDMQFEGEIVDYFIRPLAITQDASAAETRLSITVNVRFFNGIDPEKDFEAKFSAYQDFESTVSLQDVQAGLVEDIINQISEDIFNKAFTDW